MSHSFVRRWFVAATILAMALVTGKMAVAQSMMPPSQHLPAAVRAAMQQEEAKRTGQWKHAARPVRDAGKRSVVNSPAASPTQVLVSGTKQMPCILMKFPDFANTYSTTDFQNLLFVPSGIPTGSARDYYTEISFGQLALAGQVERR